MALAASFVLWLVLLGLWCDVDSRLQRVERVVYSIAGSYPDGQFHFTVTDAVPW